MRETRCFFHGFRFQSFFREKFNLFLESRKKPGAFYTGETVYTEYFSGKAISKPVRDQIFSIDLYRIFSEKSSCLFLKSS